MAAVQGEGVAVEDFTVTQLGGVTVRQLGLVLGAALFQADLSDFEAADVYCGPF